MRRSLLLLVSAAALLIPASELRAGTGHPVIGGGPAPAAGSATISGPSVDVSCDPTGCGGGGGGGDINNCLIGRSYAGFQHSLPGVGDHVSATTGDYFGLLRNGGFIAGWVGVTKFVTVNGKLTLAGWIQAGVDEENDGAHLYIEYNPTGKDADDQFLYSQPAETSHQYVVAVYHDGNGLWHAYVDRYPDSFGGYTSPTVNLTPNVAQLTSEAYNLTSACNILEYPFWAPRWAPAQMQEPLPDAPYTVDIEDGGADWTSYGPP